MAASDPDGAGPNRDDADGSDPTGRGADGNGTNGDDPEPSDETHEPSRGRLRRAVGRLLGIAAWILGSILIALGVFGINSSPAVAGFYLLAGLFITPRTRSEIKGLCRLWCAPDE